MVTSPTDMVEIYPTRFAVVTFPPDHPLSLKYDDMDTYNLTIEWRDVDRWAICRIGCQCWNGSDWEYESSPSNREDDFLKRCRFPLSEAIDRAAAAAASVRAMVERRFNGT